MSVDITRPHVLENELRVLASRLRMKIHHEDRVAEFSCLNGAVDCIPGRWLKMSGLDAGNGLRILLHHAGGCLNIHLLNIILHLLTVHAGTDDVEKRRHASHSAPHLERRNEYGCLSALA